jgi:histidinol-phosphate aminotransferase
VTRARTAVGGYARSAIPAGLVRLDLNEAPREMAQPFIDRVLELLAASSWRRYPDIDNRAARASAAALYGWSVEGTLVGNGSNDLLAAAARALLPRGGAVAALSPSFSMYPVLAKRQEARLLAVRLGPPDFSPARDELLAAAAAADLVLLCSPNNPTGGALAAALWDEVLALGKPTIWDAAYAEFATADPLDWLPRHRNLLVLRSLSKAWGLAGLRVGAMLGAPELIERVAAQLLPFETGWAVAAAYQAASELRALGAELVAEIAGERERQIDALRRLGGVEVVPSAGNFFLLRRPGLSGTQLTAAMTGRGLAVRDILELEEAGHVRVTVGTRADGDALLRALEEVCRG